MSRKRNDEPAPESTTALTAPLPVMRASAPPVEPDPVVAAEIDRSAAAAEARASASQTPEPNVPQRPTVIDELITDIRYMFAPSEPHHMEIVKDLRDPDGRNVRASEDGYRALAKAVAMRADLADMGIDPGAPATSDDAATAIGGYRDYLYTLHRERADAA